MTRPFSWPVRLGPWRRWAIALGVALVVLRVALPYALRPLLESQASKAINARVDIGDVDLALHRAGIALEDVAVHPARWTPDMGGGEPALIAWKRFAVAVHWLPLLRKTIQLRELVLESPRVALDRLQDGGLNVMALVPASGTPAAAPEGTPPPAAGANDDDKTDKKSSWSFGVDRVVLRDGGIRFRDLTLDDAEPVEMSLGSFEVKDIALSPAVYGEPAHMHLRSRVDEGRFDLDASFTPHDDGGFALASHIKARRLPLRRTRLYVPKVGWSDLQGEFGGALDYVLESGGRNEVRGQMTIDGLDVHVPFLDGPGLAWKRLAVQVDPIDLAGHRAAVRLVDLSGMWLVARTRGGIVFPFLGELLTGEKAAATSGAEGGATAEPEASGAAEPAPPPAAPPSPPAAAAPPAESVPWQWSVRLVRVTESLLHAISPDASFDAGIELTLRRLQSEGEEASPIVLALAVGDGSVTADGKLRVRPLGFDGRVKASQVSLPDIVATAGAFPPGVVQSARLDADLGIAAGVLAPTAGDIRVEGSIAFDDPKLVGAGGPTLEFGAKRLAFGMQPLLIPGGLPEHPPAVAADAHLQGGSVTVQDMGVTRTQPTPLDLRLTSLEARIDDLTAPGVGPPPPDGGALRVRGKMNVADLFLGNAGGSALDIGASKMDVSVGEFVLPGILAAAPASVTEPMRLALGSVSLVEPTATGTTPQKLDARARGVTVSVGELLVPGPLGGVPGDVRMRAAKLAVDQPRVVDTRVGMLDARARSIDVGVDDLVAPGTAATAGPGPRLTGARLALADPAVAGTDPKEFAVGAHSIGIGVQEIALGGGTASAPTRVRLRDVSLASPRVQVTRTAEGLKLPVFGSDGAAPTPPSTTTTPTSAAPSPPVDGKPTSPAPVAAQAGAGSQAAPPPAPPTLDLAVDSFRLTAGRISVTDRAVKPFYSGGLDPLTIDVAGLRWPALAASRLHVEATSAQKGKITINGAIAPSGGKVQVDGREIPLQQFNPYATTLSPYSIRKGRLSVATTATFTPGKYASQSHLTLHDFDLGSRAGDSLFKEQFGIPLTMALALLRNLQGDIVLDIPVEGDEQGMHVGYLSIIAGALRRALVNALASPLKLVGAIFSGDKVQAAPAPISFRTGRDALTDDGGKQVDQLAKFLSDRPVMAVALTTAPTNADVRWLREHDLLEELGAPQGVLGTVRNFTKRGVRDRIRDAIAAREEGKAGELDADDSKTLEDWLAERPAPAADRIHGLAAA